MTSQKQIEANRRNATKSTGPKTAKGKQMARMSALKHGLQAEHVVIPGEDPEEFEALFRGLEEHYQPVGSVEGLLVERITHCTWRLQRVSLIETAIMRKEHFSLEGERAHDEMNRAHYEIGRVRHEMEQLVRGCKHHPGKHDLEAKFPEDPDERNLAEDKAKILIQRLGKAEEDYKKSTAVYEKTEDELKSSFCSLEVVFRRSTDNLEKLSRYETTMERRLRNAIQDLERAQAARRAEAAATATVIDITDLARAKS